MLSFNSYESEPLSLSKGIEQGCPLSGILFQFYNTDLVDVCKTANGEEAVTFIDDTLLLARVKMLNKSNDKVKDMMVRHGRGLDWLATHQCKFMVNKFGIMELTRRRELNPSGSPRTRPIPHWPIFLQGVKVLVVSMHKFLGMLLDQEMCLKEQLNYTLRRGTTWVMQYHRLAKPSKGVAAKYMRCF